MDRASADTMGMLATVINSLALQDALGKTGRFDSGAFGDRDAPSGRALHPAARDAAFGKGRVVIFAGGTGNPYFTTDTTASLRAMEVGAEVILKATKVEGVYDADPFKHEGANKFEELSLYRGPESRAQSHGLDRDFALHGQSICRLSSSILWKRVISKESFPASRLALWSAEESDERSDFHPAAKRNGGFGWRAAQGARPRFARDALRPHCWNISWSTITARRHP